MDQTNPVTQDQDSRPAIALRVANAGFLNVEHGIYIVLGCILSLSAVLALVTAVGTLWHGAMNLPEQGDTLLMGVDHLLFVLMLAEILHTVRVSIGSGLLDCEPFLIVGLIACIRRVLVITLASAHTGSAAERQASFESSMIELGVLAVLILVMVMSIYVLRRGRSTGRA